MKEKLEGWRGQFTRSFEECSGEFEVVLDREG